MKEDRRTVFNVPFNAMYRTLDIMGWPRLTIKLEGPDLYGNNIVLGYVSCIIPIQPGSHEIDCHIFRPVQPKFIGLVFKSQPKELHKEADESLIAEGKGREVSSVEHMGSLRISISVSHKNFNKFGYVV